MLTQAQFRLFQIQRSLLIGGLFFSLISCSNAPKTDTVPATTTPSETSAATARSTPVAAPSKPDPVPEPLTCVRENDVRTLEVEAVKPAGCKLWYSRSGTKSVVGSSEKSNSHCAKVQTRMQKSLEITRFQCTPGALARGKSAPKGGSPESTTNN